MRSTTIEHAAPRAGSASVRGEVDGTAITGQAANGPLLPGGLPRGSHTLRATDGLGRTEVQTIDVSDQPLDVQLLPAVMASVDGAYRRTWSTVLSPLPPDVTWRGTAEPWLALADPQPFASYGLRAAHCALEPSAAHQAVEVELKCV